MGALLSYGHNIDVKEIEDGLGGWEVVRNGKLLKRTSTQKTAVAYAEGYEAALTKCKSGQGGTARTGWGGGKR